MIYILSYHVGPRFHQQFWADDSVEKCIQSVKDLVDIRDLHELWIIESDKSAEQLDDNDWDFVVSKPSHTNNGMGFSLKKCVSIGFLPNDWKKFESAFCSSI